ncbi:MAG: hypothetical protein KatS3mg052_2441 [Candidatus Roseilinea sp.]|nr:MAG: hypothetical protein KatS3mg052_2441 [Candidatus Roseilinea sp.]
MASLKELLDFISRNPPQGDESAWQKCSWEKELNKSLPGWQEVIRDQANWPEIEKAQPRGRLLELCKLFVMEAGDSLAKRWLTSGVSEQALAALQWVCKPNNLDSFLFSLNANMWKDLPEQVKRYLVFHVFEQYPGEPFDSIMHYYNRGCVGERIPDMTALLLTGYIPSRHISQLRSVIQLASDSRFERIIDDMIAQRERACQLSTRVPYTPSRAERQLIARLMRKARQGGFRAAALPPIFLSYETPPLFVDYPQLEDEEEQVEPQRNRNDRNEEVDRRRDIPETISIEKVLGCYIPDRPPQILLYAKGLKWCARKLGFDEESLRAVVLIHEIGHWMSHLLPKPGVPEWPLEHYKLTEENVHEGWAQLMTWWIAKDVSGDIKDVFEKLNKSQSCPYRVFEKFTSKPVNSVMTSLEGLRRLGRPAGIKDWEDLL